MILSLAGSLCLASNFITAKYGVTRFGVTPFLFVWMAAATVYALSGALIGGHWQRLASERQPVGKVALVGLVTGMGMLAGWSGLASLGPSFAALLWRFMPVLTILLGSIFLSEHVAALELIPLSLMISGAVLSVTKRWNVVGQGVILTSVGVAATAVQMLLSKTITDVLHPRLLVFFRVSISAIVVGCFGLISGGLVIPGAAGFWAITLGGAFVGEFLGWLFFYESYRFWDLSRTSMVRLTEPLLVLPMALVVLGDAPTVKELIGGAAILGGAGWLLAIWVAKRRSRPDTASSPG